MMRDRLREGMTVWSADGHKLGKILSRGPDGFIVEKGTFFEKEYLTRYEYIDRFGDNGVVLTATRNELAAGLRGGSASPTAESRLEKGKELSLIHI